MKRKILTISIAIITGLILAFIVLTKLSFEVHSLETIDIYILQAGIYNNYSNALKKKNIVEGVIYKDNNQYIVLKGVSLTEDGIDKIDGLYKEKYYKKRIRISSGEKNKIDNYQSILNNSNDSNTIMYINKRLMAIVGES